VWKFKGCPRCKGDLRMDVEEHHLHEYCLQCGYSRDLGVVGYKMGVAQSNGMGNASLAS
jgi:hypothetical protein